MPFIDIVDHPSEGCLVLADRGSMPGQDRLPVLQPSQLLSPSMKLRSAWPWWMQHHSPLLPLLGLTLPASLEGHLWVVGASEITGTAAMLVVYPMIIYLIYPTLKKRGSCNLERDCWRPQDFLCTLMEGSEMHSCKEMILAFKVSTSETA